MIVDLERGSARRRWILRYSGLYMVVALPLLASILLSGKTLLWGNDAYYQQYPVLCYASSLLRGLLTGKGFPMVEFSLGQGLDTIGTLAYYGLTDPFQWMGALFQGDGLEIYYHALIFIYIYLAGLFFCLYLCQTRLVREEDGWTMAIAGVVFISCGYLSIGVIKNPYYASGSLYLCLMLIGVERILKSRRWLMMSLVTALMLMANFYLAYTTTLLTVLYVLIRLFSRVKAQGIRKIIGEGLVLMGSYLLGLMLSMVILLPVALNFLSSGRSGAVGGYTDSLLHYPLTYYFKLAMLFCAPYDYAGYWALQSFCPLALMAVAMLFRRDHGRELECSHAVRNQLRAGFLATLLCLCLPLAGKVFNGFGYVTNRWCYGYAFAVCLCVAWAIERFVNCEWKVRRRIAWGMFVWGVLMLGYALIAHKLPQMSAAGNAVALQDYGASTKNLAGLLGGLAVLGMALFLMRLGRHAVASQAQTKRALALATALCCALYTAGYGVAAATSSAFLPAGLVESVQSEPEAAASQFHGDGFYRVDSGYSTDAHAGILGYHGTSYYWSMIPGWISDHYRNLELSTMRWIFRVEGLGADSYLDALAGVQCCLREEEELPDMCPYGCVWQETQGGINIYRNECALPLGYVFTQQMSESAYAQLNPVQKRQALISCAVLEDGNEFLPSFEGELNYETLDWELVSADGATLEGNELRGTAGSMLTLRFHGLPDSETYLRMRGPRVLEAQDDTDAMIACLTEAGVNGMYLIRQDGTFNYDQTGACMRLGYSEDGMTECVLRLRDDCVIQFDALELLSVPTDSFRGNIAQLQQNGWQPKVENNRMIGTVQLEERGALQIAVPYSRGWSARVNGEPAELLRCGGMYMALILDAGEYEVELTYLTPGLIPGLWVSLGAVVMIVVACASSAIRRRRGVK